MAGFLSGSVKAIGLKETQLKLAAATPHILIHNAEMVGEMLEYVKAEVEPQMPVVPTRLGRHARDSYRITVSSGRLKTTGRLWGAVQAYWREYGTLGRFHKRGSSNKVAASMARAASYAINVGTGGEAPRPITQHALAGVKKFIAFYYGGLAKWYRLP